jgi:hypothetical protein
MAEPAPSNPLDDTQEIPAVRVPPPRRPALRSRKFWCVVVLTLIPAVNWLTIQMPLDHALATMFPWAAWGGGEWALDLMKLARELRRVPSE